MSIKKVIQEISDYESKSKFDELLFILSSELSNFSHKMIGNKLKNTYVLSPYGSDLFGVSSQGKDIYIGVYSILFNILKECDLLYLGIVDKRDGLYLVFNDQDVVKTIRIFKSNKIRSIISKQSIVTFIEMNDRGISKNPDFENTISINVRNKEYMDWE